MKQKILSIILFFGLGFSTFAQNQNSDCPVIRISGGGKVQPGQPMIFTANISGLSADLPLKYTWEVSTGTISSGQETPAIEIDTTGLNRVNITATVEIKGLPEKCLRTASETGTVFGGGPPREFDQFGKLTGNEIKARIQNLYVELGNIESGKGYIINYGTDKEIAARERQIRKTIKFFKFDENRVKMVRGGASPRANGVWSKIYIVPNDFDISEAYK